jgi:hypothetical protein
MLMKFAVAGMLSSLLVAGCATGGVGTTRQPAGDVVIVGDRGPLARAIEIPPGHYPPPGECRVWYAGRPPGQQPPPVRCDGLRGYLRRGAGMFVLYNRRAWDADHDWRAEERRNPGSVPAIILSITAR